MSFLDLIDRYVNHFPCNFYSPRFLSLSLLSFSCLHDKSTLLEKQKRRTYLIHKYAKQFHSQWEYTRPSKYDSN